MKRVLYIAYFFPPLGGAGVQRSLKFVRYLPQCGWMATVLTARAAYWMSDSSLLADIPPSAKVLRAPFWGGGLAGTKPPSRPSSGRRSHGRIRILRFFARSVLIPDAYVGWVWPALRLARRELASSAYSAILTTSSPDSTHLLGRSLKRATGVPWVADFRDPWTRRLAYVPSTRFHDRLHHELERSCLSEADRVIVTSEETRRDFLALYPDLPDEKFAVIPNGYDEEDFRAARSLIESGAIPPLLEESAGGSGSVGPIGILHAGQLNPERPLTPFLRGLQAFVNQFPGRAGEARTLFLGGHYDRDVAEVRRLGLGSFVEFRSGRPHLESIASLMRARILLLLEHDSDRGRLILPGKTFEYLRAGRPILAVVPTAGAAARMVREFNAGYVADPKSPDDIARGIAALLDSTADAEFTSRTAPRALAESIPQALRQFERPHLALRLAQLLDSIAR